SRDRQPRRGVREAQAVVAGRSGDHAALALRLPEPRQLERRAPQLERTRDLQTLELDEAAERRREQQRRAPAHGARLVEPHQRRRSAIAYGHSIEGLGVALDSVGAVGKLTCEKSNRSSSAAALASRAV